ncbi:cytochrome c-type biogenesis protein cycL [Ehrlichia ruminantium]|nr:cytochrome c-type biogenesis protein CcmH [Ehrlichia ruminantium]QLK52348.1 cytochrome c-type biogenesis protein CcmH [Ehrlichia ruminantium]QLK54178.1 cytochrome c-type biogenesis protein CcmH [Ehrlichia ruminantium]QLK56930.1 cytochrome c-type biogenesis protein CcmH [Ehrlichia ruminantium]QLK57844.1 cytochrome c-type biogenesis protein CcmH [Ehrlichia ruminantium]QLK58761.1 cytochrome c-type biogenesis protein CcmH [Ehrlichia ruminantium]
MRLISNSVILIISFMAIFSFSSAYSFLVDEKLKNSEMELRAVNLFKITRCLICSGESIYESQSQFSHDMRMLIRNYIKNGYNDNQIITELRHHYGNQIIIIPPYNLYAYFLWFLPVIIFCLGIILTLRFIYIKCNVTKI